MLTPPKSISKPNIRRHSSLEKLLVDHHQHHHQLHQAFDFSCFPSPTCRKPHSRILICIFFLLFFFITILLFMHSVHIESPDKTTVTEPHVISRKPPILDKDPIPQVSALKGLGTVFRRGTKSMNELVVAHVAENTSLQDFKLFLRTLHRSGVTARADVVFLFALNTVPSAMLDAIHEENNYFNKLLCLLSSDEMSNHSTQPSHLLLSSSSPSLTTISTSTGLTDISNSTISTFNLQAFRKAGSDSESYSFPLWGIHNSNFTNQANRTTASMNNTDASILSSFGWGSIIGFDVSELNPDNALQGFIDQPPLALRRWACYQMLLGMVRHKFKHILLSDVSGVAILGDPISMTRRKVGLYLSFEDRAWGVGDELGTKWGLFDADQNIMPEDVTATSNNPPNTSDARKNNQRQLNTHLNEQLSVPQGRVDADGSSDAGKHDDIVTENQITGQNRPRRPSLDMHKRSSGGRKRRGKKALASGGLYEKVYGKTMWSSLEEGERRKKLVNSGAIVGSIHQIRGLANTMVTEIVKVALERKSREPFPDSVLLSYLLHKSSTVLGKRVLDHLHLMENAESFVHSLEASQQSSFFYKKSRYPYPMIHGSIRSKRWENVASSMRRDICSSPAEASVYTDC